jgi:SWI/SNF-related matrix-associated actin-dependent regulator of chromatin subfamily A-like protein 1
MRHQHSGAAFLAERDAAVLADEPGLGKTCTAIEACCLVDAKTILVLCPAAVRNTWVKEFHQWSREPRIIDVIEGNPRQRPAENTVTIIGHDALALKYVNALLAQVEYDVIIIDEIHAFRNYTAKRALFLYDDEWGLYHNCRHFWGLSGTLMVNSAADFWLLMNGPLRMPANYYAFVTRYTELTTGFQQKVVPRGVRNADELAERLRPFVLRRTIESLGIELPPLTVTNIRVGIDPTIWVQLNTMLEEKGWTEVKLRNALQRGEEPEDQVLATVRRGLGLAKLEAIEQQLRELAKPVVGFFQHTEVRKELFYSLQPSLTSWIDGTITRSQLSRAEFYFQQGNIDILLVQTQAGGVGLTLHRACNAVVAELPWTSVALEQAIKRIHRIGQTEACNAYVLHAADCWLEDMLTHVIERKKRAADELLEKLVVNY